VDGTCLGSDYELTCARILDAKPDYVGITAAAISIDNADRLAGMIKGKGAGYEDYWLAGLTSAAVPEDNNAQIRTI